MRRLGVLIAWLALAAGCSRDDQVQPKPVTETCVDGDPHCGDGCGPKRPCPEGLFCDDGHHCAKVCVIDEADEMCRGETRCDEHGACTGDQPVQGDGDASLQSTPGSERSDGGDTSPDASVACNETQVHATRVVPTVILIVDQSVSMNAEFGEVTRWQAVRDLLLDEKKGLIADLQKQVRFGLALYSAVSMEGSPLPMGECPMMTTVEPAFDNLDAIADKYLESEPIDDGPAGDAIDKVVETFALGSADANANTVFVFATDGEADRCEELDPPTNEAEQEAVDAVARAFALGIRTYVVSVGADFVAKSQQQIANAGLGRMPGEPDAEYWTADDGASLRASLTAIVSSQLGCELALRARVAEGSECKGTVTLNGADLECNGKEGWKLVDATHIKLLGDACEELKANEDVVLDVKFPCTYPI